MPAMTFRCPEKGCDEMVECWVPNYPQHQSEHDANTACKTHKQKYAKIREKHVKDCERLGVRP